MSLWIEGAEAASVLNVLLLLGLGAIWGRNYRLLRSKHALGLLVFGGLLLAENLLWVYVYLVNPALIEWMYDAAPVAQQAMLGLCGLESVGLLVLAWITWD